MQTALVRIGLDINLFTLLSENKDAMTVQELAIKTKAAPLLLCKTPLIDDDLVIRELTYVPSPNSSILSICRNNKGGREKLLYRQ